MVHWVRSKLNEQGASAVESFWTASYFDIMNRAKKCYARCLEPICKQWSLTQNELAVLLFLQNNPSLSRAADIVTCRGISKSHVSLSVTNLERRGLLRRRFDPNDRRMAHLELTEQGRAIAREGQDAQYRFFFQIHGGITEEDFSLWKKITQKVCDNIENLDKVSLDPYE